MTESKQSNYISIPVEETGDQEFVGRRRHRKQPLSSTLSHWSTKTLQNVAVVVLCVLFVVGLNVVAFFLGKHSVSQVECGAMLSAWSPAWQAVEYEEVMFDGKFTAPSIYRGKPTPELDSAWEDMIHRGLGSLRIPKDHLGLLNKSTERVLTFGDGTGDAQGALEVFHQLHCLNEIRKKTWPGYYPEIEEELKHVDRVHLDHCIEMIRINIMCTADITPIIAVYPDGNGGKPTPDFSTLHTCRSFERIFDYVQNNAESWGVWG